MPKSAATLRTLNVAVTLMLCMSYHTTQNTPHVNTSLLDQDTHSNLHAANAGFRRSEAG